MIYIGSWKVFGALKLSLRSNYEREEYHRKEKYGVGMKLTMSLTVCHSEIMVDRQYNLIKLMLCLSTSYIQWHPVIDVILLSSTQSRCLLKSKD